MDYAKQAQDVLDCIPALRSNEGIQKVSNVTAGEFAALLYLATEHNGATAGELTSAIRVGSSRTTAIMQSLERKGLLKREIDPDDGRRVLAVLTDQGVALEQKQRNEALQHIQGLLEYLGSEDAEALSRIMKKFVEYNENGKKH